MTTPIVQTATAHDEPSIVGALMLAFSADPAARWTWPDSHQYISHFS